MLVYIVLAHISVINITKEVTYIFIYIHKLFSKFSRKSLLGLNEVVVGRGSETNKH